MPRNVTRNLNPPRDSALRLLLTKSKCDVADAAASISLFEHPTPDATVFMLRQCFLATASFLVGNGDCVIAVALISSSCPLVACRGSFTFDPTSFHSSFHKLTIYLAGYDSAIEDVWPFVLVSTGLCGTMLVRYVNMPHILSHETDSKQEHSWACWPTGSQSDLLTMKKWARINE